MNKNRNKQVKKKKMRKIKATGRLGVNMMRMRTRAN